MQAYLSNYNQYTEYLFQNSENILSVSQNLIPTGDIGLNDDTPINSEECLKNDNESLVDGNMSSWSTDLGEESCSTPKFGTCSIESFQSRLN